LFSHKIDCHPKRSESKDLRLPLVAFEHHDRNTPSWVRFVSGHDFSRAANGRKMMLGFSPCEKSFRTEPGISQAAEKLIGRAKKRQGITSQLAEKVFRAVGLGFIPGINRAK
jgi:hypothetical protein